MKRYIYFIVFVAFFNFLSVAQIEERKFCGTSEVMEEALKNLEKQQILDQLEIFTEEFIANIDNNRLGGPYIIPVVVHVVHDYEEENISYNQIDDGVSRINDDFNGFNEDLSEVIDSFTNIIGFPQIEFRLATKDPDGNCTYGVTRTSSDLTTSGSSSKLQDLISWDDKKYVNIWVVRSFESGSSAAAFAFKPGSGPRMDGIFCLHNYFGSGVGTASGGNWTQHTMPHEMGHFFNLDHPWGGSNSPGEADNCSMDDGVEDTPPTIGTDANALQAEGLTGCPLDQATCDGSLDNVQNIMDYSSCAHMFTQGQSDRMLAAVNSLAGNRWYLWQEDNLTATGTDDASLGASPYVDCAPIPDFKADTDLGCSGSEIKFENYTYNYRNENITYSWTFDGGVPSTSTAQNPEVLYENPGSYDVVLTACNGENCLEEIRQNFVTIVSQTNVSVEEGFSQGFESSTFPIIDLDEIWWLGDDLGEQHWERTELASTEGVSSFRIKSQNYGYDRQAHEFSTPELNMSEFTTSSSDPLMICFDVAYAKRLPYNWIDYDYELGGYTEDDLYSIHHDDLIISYKVSCDVSEWTERPRISTRNGFEGYQQQWQQNLITTDKIYFNSFVPEASDWKQFCVNIQSLAGNQEAIIKFTFSGTGEDQDLSHFVDVGGFIQEIDSESIGGNWLYLDNIVIGNSSDIESTTNSRNSTIENLVVSPNPSIESEAWITFETAVESEIKISISNFLGLNMGRLSMNLSGGVHSFQLSELFNLPNKGTYVIAIEDLDSRLSEIIILK